MTHSYDDHGGLPARTRTERLTALGVGAVMAVAGILSLVHLIDQYRKATPWREARAAERERERQAEEAREKAADALRDARGNLPPPVAVAPAPPGAATPPDGPFRMEDLSPEQRRAVERMIERESGGATPVPQTRSRPQRPAVSQPIRWYIPPSWPSVRNDAFPDGVSRMGVQFRCRVTRDGVLARCDATESPSGAGLAARMRPALDRARVSPPTINGRAVESEITFGVSFSAAPRRVAVPPPADKPDVDAPASMPPSAQLSADRLATPPPVSAPAN